MAVVHNFPSRTSQTAQSSSPPLLHDDGEPPYDGGMEARLSAVEQAIVRLDATLPNLATKSELAELRADVHKGFADQTKWIIGTAFGGIAVFITVMTFVLNNAAPKSQPQPSQQPIIINVPQAQQPATPASK